MPPLQTAADIAHQHVQQTEQQQQQQQQQQQSSRACAGPSIRRRRRISEEEEEEEAQEDEEDENAVAFSVDAGAGFIASQTAGAAESQQSPSADDASHSGLSLSQILQATEDAALLRAQIRRIWPLQLDAGAVLNFDEPPEPISDVWFRASLSSIDFRCIYNVYALAYGQSPELIHAAIAEALRRHPFWADGHERVNCRCSDHCKFIRRVKNFVCHDVVDGSPKTVSTEVDTLRKQADDAIAAWEKCDTSDLVAAGATAAAANTAVQEYIHQHWSTCAFGGDALLQLYAHHQQDRVDGHDDPVGRRAGASLALEFLGQSGARAAGRGVRGALEQEPLLGALPPPPS